jgi:hypothetical protein
MSRRDSANVIPVEIEASRTPMGMFGAFTARYIRSTIECSSLSLSTISSGHSIGTSAISFQRSPQSTEMIASEFEYRV